jgi:agmatine deiminase
VRFNGWGNKQRHAGDRRLAEIVAKMLRLEVVDSGVVGEGGGLEVDGDGTVLAAESSWVNENRNPGRSRADIEAALVDLVGAERFLWVEGLPGRDITDDHIDSQARFATPTTIVLDRPVADAPDDVWSRTATKTRDRLGAAHTRDGKPYAIADLVQPERVRRHGAGFLATYLNYYVCNGAVLAPSFGDPLADDRARDTLAELFPTRRVVQLDIDPVAAGGGGIHCATQQQPVPAN